MARKATTTKTTTTAKKAAPKKAAATRKTTTAKKAAPRKATAPRKTAAKKGNGKTLSLSLPEEQAAALARAAVQLDTAKTGAELGAALELNMDTWVAIRALARSAETSLPDETRNNLDQLAGYVIATTLGVAQQDLTDQQIRTLIDIDLQISEGLLEGYAADRVREEAYHMWEADGRPEGNDQHYWFVAEQKVRRDLGA